MSTCCSLRLHPPLKKVLTKLENLYQMYISMYKTHTMATHHRGTGQPLEKYLNPQDHDIDILSDYQHGDIDDFENRESEYNTWLRDLTNKVYHLHPSALPEPLDEVLQQYTETLCTAQKKSTFTNTLLQDITIFNGSNSFHLEDWLINVDTTADLTSESRTKLAQAKSKGLTHILISEAISSDKSWEKIKDLHLKICNFDIHTSVSHFMEIQQKEKESLAAYIHRFKREAKTCNFTNNTARICIFVKGLKMPTP